MNIENNYINIDKSDIKISDIYVFNIKDAN